MGGDVSLLEKHRISLLDPALGRYFTILLFSNEIPEIARTRFTFHRQVIRTGAVCES